MPTRSISATTFDTAEATMTGFILTGTSRRPNSGVYVEIWDENGDAVGDENGVLIDGIFFASDSTLLVGGAAGLPHGNRGHRHRATPPCRSW